MGVVKDCFDAASRSAAVNPSTRLISGEFAPSGNGLYGVCRVRDALGQRIYVHSLGATIFFFAVSAEKMDFRGSEVGSSLKGTAFLSDAWRRVGTLLRPESSAVVCAGGSSLQPLVLDRCRSSTYERAPFSTFILTTSATPSLHETLLSCGTG